MDKSKNWIDISLEDVADLTVGFVGKTTNHYVNNGIRFLRSQNVEPFRINLADERFIDEPFHRSIKKSQLEAGDVVIVRTGNPGASAVIPEKNEEWNCSDLVIIKPDHTRINSTFLAAFLNLSYGVISSNLVGAVQQHFNVGAAKKLRLKLPSLKEQNIIASYIDSLNEKITINEKINQNLDEQAKAIFKSWFIDYDHWNGQMPSNWIETSLGKICSCELGGTPSRANKDYWNGTIPWINSGEVNKFRIIKPSETITELGLSKSATKLLPVKTTVIAITGATLGQVSLLEIASCANQSVVGVIPNEKLPYEFIYPLITAKIQELISHQTGGAQQHINKQNVESLSFMMPTQDVISAYTNLVNALYARIATNCFENERLTELRDSLLPKLMSAEIDVSEIEI